MKWTMKTPDGYTICGGGGGPTKRRFPTIESAWLEAFVVSILGPEKWVLTPYFCTRPRVRNTVLKTHFRLVKWPHECYVFSFTYRLTNGGGLPLRNSCGGWHLTRSTGHLLR